jgi:hypothetical protein
METFRSIEYVVRSAEVGSFAEVARCSSDSWGAISIAKQEVCFEVRLFSAAAQSESFAADLSRIKIRSL